MRVLFPLIFTFCVVYSLPIQDLESEFKDFSYESLLDFDMWYSPELQPFVSVACAGLEYINLVFEDSPYAQKANSLTKSVCSGLPTSERIDMNFIQKCMESEECWTTGRTEFLAGTTPDNDFFYYFNMTSVPKKKRVSKCLEADSCEHREEAVHLLSQWNNIIANCDQQEEPQQVLEAMDGVRTMAMSSQSEDNTLDDFYVSISKCLKVTPSEEVKRAISAAFNTTIACSKDVQGHIMDYMESDSDMPMDVAMDLSKKVMACDNEAVYDIFGEMLLQQGDDFKAGYAIWETMRMMNEENFLLRKKRGLSGMEQEWHLNDIVNKQELKEKWNENPYVWRYTYSFDEYQVWGIDQPVYSIVVSTGKDATGPITIRISEVYDYPPIDNHITIALESPILNEVHKVLNGEHREFEQYLDVIEKVFHNNGDLPPFKVSVISLSDSLNYTTPELQVFVSQLYVQLLKMGEAMQTLPKLGEIALSNIGKTAASFNMKYSMPDENSIKVDVTSKTPTNKDFVVGTLSAKLTENDNGDLGYIANGMLYILDGLQVYSFDTYFQPLTEMKDDKTNCEMEFNLLDATYDSKIFTWSSCSRPIYMADSDEIVESISNMYKILDIPSFLKINFTLDFGDNGLFAFIASPKQFLVTADYMDKQVLDFGVKFENIAEKVMKSDAMLNTQTTIHLGIPAIYDQTAELKITSDIFDDLASNSSYSVKTFPNKEGVEKVYTGLLTMTSCSRGTEDIVSTFLIGQGPPSELPRKICYDVLLDLPNEKGYISQQFSYNTRKKEFDYKYEVLTDCPFEAEGSFKYWLEEVMSYWDVFGSVRQPIPADFHLTNLKLVDFYLNGIEGNYFHLSTKSGFIFIIHNDVLPYNDVLRGSPLVVSMSTWDYYWAKSLIDEVPSTYLLCQVDFDWYEEFHCDAKTVHGSNFTLEIDLDFAIATFGSDKHGIIDLSMSDDESRGQFFNTHSDMFANFSVKYADKDNTSVHVFFKPAELSSEWPMCELIKYEAPSPTIKSDSQCIKNTMNEIGFNSVDFAFLDILSDMNADDAEEAILDWVDQSIESFSVDNIRTFVLDMIDAVMNFFGAYSI